jgi:hypothetical protein
MSMRSVKPLMLVVTLLFCLVTKGFALDARSNTDWISMGVPEFTHMGTDGVIYINGSDHGKCNGIRPDYFRVDMSAPHWKELWAWILWMAARQKRIDCVVFSGCSETQVWVNYCRGSFK